MATQVQDAETALKAGAKRLRRWLFDHALPMWQREGFDPESGRFCETIEVETGKAKKAPTRARVPPRQVYSFIAGGRLGWQGEWQDLALNGLDRYLEDFSGRGRLDDQALRPGRRSAG